jgi:hypothetical protein
VLADRNKAAKGLRRIRSGYLIKSKMKIQQSIRHPSGAILEKFLLERGGENVTVSKRRHV